MTKTIGFLLSKAASGATSINSLLWTDLVEKYDLTEIDPQANAPDILIFNIEEKTLLEIDKQKYSKTKLLGISLEPLNQGKFNFYETLRYRPWDIRRLRRHFLRHTRGWQKYLREYYDSVGGNRFSVSHVRLKKENHYQMPLPLHERRVYENLDELAGKKKRLTSNGKRKFCMFLCSNGERILRNKLFRELSAYKTVDSFGSVFNNKPSPPIQPGELLPLFEQYKFIIAIENTLEENFYTFRVTDPYLFKTVPIVQLPRDKRTQSEINPKAVVDAAKFRCLPSLVKRIIELDNDENLYDEVANQPFFKNGRIPQSYQWDNLEAWFEKNLVNC